VRRDGSRSGAQMAALWEDLLGRWHIRNALGPHAVVEDRPRAWPIPASVDEAVAATERTLFVGDAIAAADVMTGEGIGQALLTGRWAAEAMLAAGPDDALRAVRRYRQRLAHDLVPDHRMAALLERALARRGGAEAAMLLAGASPWTRRNFVRWLFEDYPRGIALTPGRIEAGMFTRDGAFT
jgi:flavin-dependent dehydrogenase